MAWERRERGGLYYTRSTKVNGRVEREYVGSGYFGQLAASLDLERRERRLAEMTALKRERAEMENLDSRVSELYEGIEDVTAAALLTTGYRKHKRGEWRKRREPKETDQ